MDKEPFLYFLTIEIGSLKYFIRLNIMNHKVFTSNCLKLKLIIFVDKLYFMKLYFWNSTIDNCKANHEDNKKELYFFFKIGHYIEPNNVL